MNRLCQRIDAVLANEFDRERRRCLSDEQSTRENEVHRCLSHWKSVRMNISMRNDLDVCEYKMSIQIQLNLKNNFDEN